MAHAPLNRLAARTLALLALLSALALPGAHPVSATPAPVPAKAAAAEEISPLDTLVPNGPSSFTVANATVFWYTRCRAGEPTTTDSISRIPVQGGESRQLYNAGDACSPSTFRSNIVADADYVYWASDSGLLRLSTNATVGDQPQLLSAAAAGSQKLVIDNNAIYTQHVTGPSPTQTYTLTVQQVAKADGATTTLTTRTASAWLGNIQVSHSFSQVSDYLYWVENGALMRYNLNSGALDTLASDVNGFYAEGSVTSCENFRCTTTDRVYFISGGDLSYYNNNDGTTTQVYSYANSVYLLKTDRKHVFLEMEFTRVTCEPVCRPSYYTALVKAKREAPGAFGILDLNGHASNLTIANGYVLWLGSGIMRQPTEVELLHLYMPVIRR